MDTDHLHKVALLLSKQYHALLTRLFPSALHVSPEYYNVNPQ